MPRDFPTLTPRPSQSVGMGLRTSPAPSPAPDNAGGRRRPRPMPSTSMTPPPDMGAITPRTPRGGAQFGGARPWGGSALPPQQLPAQQLPSREPVRSGGAAPWMSGDAIDMGALMRMVRALKGGGMPISGAINPGMPSVGFRQPQGLGAFQRRPAPPSMWDVEGASYGRGLTGEVPVQEEPMYNYLY